MLARADQVVAGSIGTPGLTGEIIRSASGPHISFVFSSVFYGSVFGGLSKLFRLRNDDFCPPALKYVNIFSFSFCVALAVGALSFSVSSPNTANTYAIILYRVSF